MVAAVNHWMTMNHEDRLATAERQCLAMMAPLRGIPGVKAELINNVIGHQPFGLRLEVDHTQTGLTVHDVVAKLKAGDPPVFTRVRDDEDWITIHVFGLSDGEDKIVGERIAALFK